MNDRIPLKLNQILVLGEFSCHIDRVLGKGSNAIVYEGWYPDTLNPEQKHAVLIKELYPECSKGSITRQEDDKLIIDAEAEEDFSMHRNSFEVGNDIHLRLLHDHPDLMGANLNSYRKNNTLYSLLGYSGGKSLQDVLSDGKGDLRSCVQTMLGILDALEAFHKSGYLHLDISPDNIMLIGTEKQKRVFLIDYNSARSLNGNNAGYISCKNGYSAHELELGHIEDLGFSTDLYSVAAVFYHCLKGRKLFFTEQLCNSSPSIRGSFMLENAPQTVRSFVKQILNKGLQTLHYKRYRNIEQMRSDFQELLDRIDCVGVTQWSLWERGRRSAEDMITANPSLHYIKEAEELYPIRVKHRDQTLSLAEYTDWLISDEGSSGLLLGQGGMGKTTLLMRTALQQGKKYSPTTSAVMYLSLSGWKFGRADYIQHQILAGLKFKPEMNTYESAVHSLKQLLECPIKTKQGNRPVLLLLLDGLNEIQGDISPLLEEIRELDQLVGVRILGASRSSLNELKMETVSLAKLLIEDVESTLGQQGLLIPESPKMLELLRTPLILSVYVKTSQIGKQLDVENESELIQAYLQSLYEKEIGSLSETSPERWQIETAITYVLPSIAAKDANLTETELLKIVTECWKTIRSKVMLRAFPQWIGHSREILGDTDTAEQWLGIMVYSILWHRLGLLVQFPDGRYQVFHQNIREYLKQEGTALQKRIHRIRWLKGDVSTRFTSITMTIMQMLTAPKAYDEKLTLKVLDSLVSCYGAYGCRLQSMEECLRKLQEEETDDFLDYAQRERMRIDSADMIFLDEQLQARYLQNIEKLCQSDGRVGWSKLPMDRDAASRLITEANTQTADYRYYLEQLIFWSQSERTQIAAKDFPKELRNLLEADARLMSKLYYKSCAVHLEKADPFLREKYEKAFPAFTASGKEPDENIKTLSDFRESDKKALISSSTVLRQMAADTEGQRKKSAL